METFLDNAKQGIRRGAPAGARRPAGREARSVWVPPAKKAEDAQDQLARKYETIKSVPESERLSNIALVARYMENRLQSEKERAKIQGELRTAEAQLKRYWVFCPINGRVFLVLGGQVHLFEPWSIVDKIEKSTQHGGWAGMAVGEFFDDTQQVSLHVAF